MEPVIWESTSVSEKLEECSSSKEREARSLALEKAYVHDVYQQIACHFSDSRHRVWPRVKQFILDLEPGSVVCDVGCGNGKYLNFNPPVYKIGLDRCSNLTNIARGKEHEVLLCDNLALPFRDECFDAVLSIAVIHHFATFERRVAAIQELARVLRIGGRLMVSVWAMEQRHRKFESQDVLVPWNRPIASSSDDKTSSIERDLNSTTTTTSDDDTTHYHAYTQTSDSDSFPSLSRECRKRGRIRHRGRSIDPTCPSSQSSSDLSSPNESCYSFVRRALQKLAGTKRNRGNRRPWFLHGLDIPNPDGSNEPLASIEDESDRAAGANLNQSDNFVPIELRQLESTDFVELLQLRDNKTRFKQDGEVIYPQRRRTLETTCDLHHSETSPIATQPKSKSLSDLFGLLPMGLLRPYKKIIIPETRKEKSEPSKNIDTEHFESLQFENDETQFSEFIRHKAVQTDSFEIIDTDLDLIDPLDSRLLTGSNVKLAHSLSPEKLNRNLRPTLVKQKQSVGSFSHYSIDNFAEYDQGRGDSNPEDADIQVKQDISPIRWGEIKQSVKNLPEFKQTNTLHPPPQTSRGGLSGSSTWKQTSLNEDLIFSERLKEKERLKQNIHKQFSLNEELIYKRENTRWDQMKEAILNPANVKCLQLLKSGISSRFRGADSFGSSDNTPGAQSKQPVQATSSLKNGIARILQNWKYSEDRSDNGSGAAGSSFIGGTTSSVFLGSRRGSKDGTTRRGLFTPFFLRRSSVGSLNLAKKDIVDQNAPLNTLSPPPYMKRGPSDNEIVQDVQGSANGNKLIPGVRHARKLSREDGSDSSKDSSFQSDTSVDSEDSFASVIFIPKTTSMDNTTGSEALCFNAESRANSTDSDRSPKSPALRLSPPNHNVPKSPSPLASELLRRRSPDVSPTPQQTTCTESSTKFIFDGSETKLTPASISHRVSSPSATEEKPLITLSTSPQQQSGLTLPVKVKGNLLRKTGQPFSKEPQSARALGRSFPKSLHVELYNPETEDADTSDSSSSSPNSVSSVVSVKEEKLHSSLTPRDESKALPVLSKHGETEEAAASEVISEASTLPQSTVLPEGECRDSIDKKEQSKISAQGLFEAAANMVSSLENLVSQSSPKASRKLTLSRLGSTTDWLSSLPSDSSQHTVFHHSQRHSTERRNPGEKILLGEVKKFQQKGPDAKWPASIGDDSPPSTAKLCPSVSLPSPASNPSIDIPEGSSQRAPELIRLGGDSDEKDSLFDSVENLSGKQPSRNPSIDSSVRMSSTCSCSIRGGDSFDSWTSAKSSLTNSSSTHHKTSLPSLIPLHAQSDSTRRMGSKLNRKCLRPDSSKSSSLAGEDTEDSTALTYHRYYHVFREGELDKLIEKYVQNLHIISSYYDHANWCIIAEKVQVWTI